MGNSSVKIQRKLCASTAIDEYNTILFELDNLRSIESVDLKLLNKLDLGSLRSLRRDLQSIQGTISRFNTSINESRKSD